MALFSVDGPIGRATGKVATSKGFRKVAPTIVPAADRLLHRVTGGRVILSRALGAQPAPDHHRGEDRPRT